jgi:hypothetical protein
MRWAGREEWREQWWAQTPATRRRVRDAVQAGAALEDPSAAALAVGLSLELLAQHRWMLLILPWLGGAAAVGAALLADLDMTVSAAAATGVWGGLWLNRLLLIGPRLSRAYRRNLVVARYGGGQRDG